MKTVNRTRTIAAGALTAVLAAGAGVAAIGTGAIALGGGSAGAAIVTTASGKVTVTLRDNELHPVATDPGYSEQICSGSGLTLVEGSCNKLLPKCAELWEKKKTTIDVVFDLNTGRVMSCNRA